MCADLDLRTTLTHFLRQKTSKVAYTIPKIAKRNLANNSSAYILVKNKHNANPALMIAKMLSYIYGIIQITVQLAACSSARGQRFA